MHAPSICWSILVELPEFSLGWSRYASSFPHHRRHGCSPLALSGRDSTPSAAFRPNKLDGKEFAIGVHTIGQPDNFQSFLPRDAMLGVE